MSREECQVLRAMGEAAVMAAQILRNVEYVRETEQAVSPLELDAIVKEIQTVAHSTAAHLEEVNRRLMQCGTRQ